MTKTFDPKGEAKAYTSVESQQLLLADIDEDITLAWHKLFEAKRKVQVLYHAVSEDTQYEALEKLDHLKDDLGDIERALEDASGAASDIDLTEEKASI